jgi:tetratricopeptide (TPR) repeat protein
MRIVLVVFNLILFAATAAWPAFAQEAGALDSEDHAEAATPLSEEDLDGLFVRLAASADEDEAKAAENEILRRFHTSGSDTTDLLMSWASRAIKDEKYSVALDILDRIVILQSDFVEGWNKRATVHYMMGEYGKAIADIEKTLALEPRHFGALSGLGLILRDMGDSRHALQAFEEALKVHPFLKNAEDMLEKLKTETGDRDA